MSKVFFGVVALGLLAAVSHAATLTYVGPNGGSWHDVANWEIDALPAGQVPTAADTVNLQSRTVHITEAATLNVFNNGGTVNIDAGGNLTGVGGNSLRYVTAIHVNDGGNFNMPFSLIRTNLTVHEGGTASGSTGIPQAEARTLTIHGTWSPRGTTLGALSFSVGSSSNASYTGKVRLGATGTIVLDVFANASNEFFNVTGFTAGSELTLNTGTVLLRTQGDYEPQIGDSFDLWNLGVDSLATMNIGDGSNIVLPGYNLDLTQWASDGIVTVASVIPEPASLALLGLGGLIMLARRR